LAQTEDPRRQKILARVRKALASPAQKPPQHSVAATYAPIADPLERFRSECAGNNTECIVTPNLRASAVAIADVLAALPAGEIFIQDAPELRAMGGAWSRHAVHWSTDTTPGNSNKRPGESSQATITLAETLVAQTGSVLVSSACGGRAAPFVAPLHIVVATAAQLVADLEVALARVREQGTALKNSYLSLITGSSRTADIEKILVMGAHGPRRLIVTVALSKE